MRKIEKKDWYGINRTHYHALYQDKLDQLIDNQNELIDFARTISKQHRIGKHHIPPVVEFPDKLEKRIAKLEDKAPPDITDGVLPEHEHRIPAESPKQQEPKAQEVSDAMQGAFSVIDKQEAELDILREENARLEAEIGTYKVFGINELKAENAELTSYCDSYRGAIFTQAERISELEAENADLKQRIGQYEEMEKRVRENGFILEANYSGSEIIIHLEYCLAPLTPKAEAEEDSSDD